MAWREDLVELFRRRCLWCGRLFGVCERCFRGQRYCSELCRKRSRREQGRERNRRYLDTEQGRESNRNRQRQYRQRQARGV